MENRIEKSGASRPRNKRVREKNRKQNHPCKLRGESPEIALKADVGQKAPSCPRACQNPLINPNGSALEIASGMREVESPSLLREPLQAGGRCQRAHASVARAGGHLLDNLRAAEAGERGEDFNGRRAFSWENNAGKQS